MTDETTVVVHHQLNGDIDYYMAGKPVRLLIIDEFAPHDRVYQFTSTVDASEIEVLVNGEVIGSKNDSRHEAIESRVLSDRMGEPRFDIAEPEKVQ